MPRALVVDDSKAMRLLLSRAVREIGYDVQDAGDGFQALEILGSVPGGFELLLIDWNMPLMNGLELLRRVRSDARYASLVVIMVTTETEIESMAAALEAGASEYVMKPFTREILLEKIQLTRLHPQETW